LNRKDGRLDELLAGGTLGGPRYDEIFEKVLERSGVPARTSAWRRLRKWFVLPSAVLVPAVAVWLIWVRPSDVPPTPKGVSDPSAAFHIGCGASGGSVCRPGDTLMISVNAAVTWGHVGAYAERVGGSAHERIWYFPTALGSAPTVAPGNGTVVLPDGIRIGSEHVAGDYRLTIWIAERPIARHEVDAMDARTLPARTTVPFRVTP
jgi:hypothetical protein